MSKLYVLGNGFDLTHQLPTRYSDFRCWLCKNDKDNPSMKNELDEMFSLSEQWSNFEEALATPKIEYEALYDNLGLLDSFKNNLTGWFNKWIRGINLNLKGNKIFKRLHNTDYYLTFNYTSLLESDIYSIPQKQICHIHGYDIESYFASTSNLCFGHGTKNSNSKLSKLLYKDTESLYKNNKNFFESIKCVDEIVVIGFSYSLIDIYYFQKINEILPNSKWLFGVFNEADIKRCATFIKIIDVKNYEIVETDNLI